MSAMSEVTIYTDGSCLGNPGPGGWGAIISSGEQTREISGGERDTTNNRMELLGAINGLRALITTSKVKIVSDSKYLTDAFNKNWIISWKRNGWARSEGPLLNSDLWKELDSLTSKHSCQFEWVKGHSGHPLNERANDLAMAASKMQVNEASADYSSGVAEETDKALVCLDKMLQLRNMEKYGLPKPCMADPWCDRCVESATFPCALAYMNFELKEIGA